MPLRLRRGTVVAEDPLTVEVDGERRPAWADTGLLGEMREGDEVVVNVAALDLELGSGGFDVVHVNLTRGLGREDDGGDGERPHVMKLNYTSIQHAVDPVEAAGGETGGTPSVLVLPLHGHLAPAAWALAQEGGGDADGDGGPGGGRVGYVQTGGGALPGSLSRDIAELRERGLLCGHIAAGPAYGAEHDAVSVTGALDAAARLGWDVAVIGPGPGIIGSDSRLGHGGMAALDNAHASLALEMPTLLSPRLSSSDPRERHRDVSHHTLTVMSMLLAPVQVAVPAGEVVPIAILATACGWRHRLRETPADLDGYAASGLPTRTMGRDIEEDPLFFAAPLAAGAALRGKG